MVTAVGIGRATALAAVTIALSDVRHFHSQQFERAAWFDYRRS